MLEHVSLAVVERHREPRRGRRLEHRAVERRTDVAALQQLGELAAERLCPHGQLRRHGVGNAVISEDEPVSHSGRSGGLKRHREGQANVFARPWAAPSASSSQRRPTGRRPRSAGPIPVLRALALELTALGHRVDVVTTTLTAIGERPARSSRTDEVDGATVRYLGTPLRFRWFGFTPSLARALRHAAAAGRRARLRLPRLGEHRDGALVPRERRPVRVRAARDVPAEAAQGAR